MHDPSHGGCEDPIPKQLLAIQSPGPGRAMAIELSVHCRLINDDPSEVAALCMCTCCQLPTQTVCVDGACHSFYIGVSPECKSIG